MFKNGKWFIFYAGFTIGALVERDRWKDKLLAAGQRRQRSLERKASFVDNVLGGIVPDFPTGDDGLCDFHRAEKQDRENAKQNGSH